MSTHEITPPPVANDDWPIAPPGRMTEEEFVAWCTEDMRAEWVDGEVIMMSPVNTDQDDLNGWLIFVMRGFIESRSLGVLHGPQVMVRFAKQRRRRVPDLLFVQESRRSIIRTNHLEGAPDLAVEIVSPESVARDWREKYLEYEAAGVREYWVIDPTSEHAEFYVLDNDGKYQRAPVADGTFHSTVLPGFFLRLAWLWQATRPKVFDALKELGVI